MYMASFLGSGPDRGQSPLEWGDFLSVRTSVRGELIKNKLEFQKRTGTKVEFHSLEPESKKKISKK